MEWGEHELSLFYSHLYLVRDINHRYLRVAHSYVDDINSYARIGLWQAIATFHNGRGSFTQWARKKIHWAVQDGLRELDYISRNARTPIKEMVDATNVLAQELGTQPTYTQLREYGVDLDSAVRAAQFSNQREPDTGEWLDKYTSPGVDEEVIAHDLEMRLSEHIQALPAQLSVIIELIYYGQYNMVEVGEILGLHGSRISQLHKEAIGRLRERVTREFL